METQSSETHTPGTVPLDRRLAIWPVLGRFLAALVRHFVPFVLLASAVGWTVGGVLFLTGLAPFLATREPRRSLRCTAERSLPWSCTPSRGSRWKPSSP